MIRATAFHRSGAAPRPRARLARFAGAAITLAGVAALVSAARAADAPLGPVGGAPCSIGQPFWVPSQVSAQELAETQGWPSVYYGHFSGGRPYIDSLGRTIIDWRDEHVCFPTSRECRAWISASYGSHHQPEGYRSCTLLR